MRATLLRDVPTGEVTLARLLEENAIITSSALVKRTLLIAAGAFSAQPGLRSVEDYELWLRMATLAPVHYLDEPLVIYQDDSADSVRRGDMPSSLWQAQLRALESFRVHLTTAGPSPQNNRLLHAIATTQLRGHMKRCVALYRESRYAMLCATQPLAAAREIASRLFSAAGHRQQQD